MKHFHLQRFIKPLVLVIIIVIGVFGIVHGSSAAGEGYVGDAVYEYASRIVSSVLYFILVAVAWGVGAMANLLNFAMRFTLDPNLFIIVNLWKIVRDFTNMFFILVLIIMAFSLIFDVSALGIPGFGGIDTRKTIVKFIVAALLINFSLVIGGLIIDGANEVNNVFLTSIGDFSSRIGQALNPSATLLGIAPEQIGGVLTVQSGQVKDVGLGHIVKMVSSIILGMIILFSLIVATFFAFVRIPILWLLLIFSPIAWISGTLPATQKFTKEWWDKFIGWNLFLPVFLFFLYVGLYFMSYQGQVLGGVATGFNAQSVQQSLLTGAGVTLQQIFYYFLVAFTLIMGTERALAVASGGGKLLTDVVGKGRNLAMGLPAFSQYRAAEGAAKLQMEQLQKEGLGSQKIFGQSLGRFGANRIYGGKAGQDRDVRAARQGMFGVPGGLDAEAYRGQTEDVSAVNKRIAELKTLETAGQLDVNSPKFESETYAMDASSTEGAARRSVLYERGKMTGSKFAQDMANLTKSNPFLAESLLEKANKGKYRNVKGDQLLAMAMGENNQYGDFSALRSPSGTTSRRMLFNAIKDNDDALKVISVPQIAEGIRLSGGDFTNDAKEFKKAIAIKRPDIVAEYESVSEDPEKNKKSAQDNLVSILEKKSVSDIGSGALYEAWNNPVFKPALEQHLKDLEKAKPGNDGKNGQKIKLGAGQRRKSSLENALDGDGRKAGILESITSVDSGPAWMPPAGAAPTGAGTTTPPPPSNPIP